MYNKILLTGGSGFVGTNLSTFLRQHYEHTSLISSNSSMLNLFDPTAIQYFLQKEKPDCVIHLAAKCGGIGANKDNPGTFMNDNLTIGLNLINGCQIYGGVKKFVMTGTICAYPKYCPVPFHEEDMWNGYPEETNAAYGIAKKTLTELLIAYNKEFGFESINLYPTNMYGPYDNFDPTTSHVIPAIILKIYKAITQGRGYVTMWGDGTVTRDFLYVYDFCHAVVCALESDPGPEPINIGTNKEISIREVVSKVAEIMGYNGEIRWDTSLPNGQPRRCVDSTRAYDRTGYRPMVPFDRGLEKTIRWFLQNVSEINK